MVLAAYFFVFLLICCLIFLIHLHQNELREYKEHGRDSRPFVMIYVLHKMAASSGFEIDNLSQDSESYLEDFNSFLKAYDELSVTRSKNIVGKNCNKATTKEKEASIYTFSY